MAAEDGQPLAEAARLAANSAGVSESGRGGGEESALRRVAKQAMARAEAARHYRMRGALFPAAALRG